MSVRWTRNGAAAAIAGFAGFALGFTGGVAIAIGLFAFAILCGLDYTAVARVQRKDRQDR